MRRYFYFNSVLAKHYLKIINIFLFLSLFWLIGAGCNNSGGNGSEPGGGIPPGPLPGDGDGGPTLNFTGLGIDYDPEARCADNISNWMGNPVACNPQPSFTCLIMQWCYAAV